MNSRSPQHLAQLAGNREATRPLSTLAIERHGAAAQVKRGTAAGRGTFGLCGHFPGQPAIRVHKRNIVARLAKLPPHLSR